MCVQLSNSLSAKPSQMSNYTHRPNSHRGVNLWTYRVGTTFKKVNTNFVRSTGRLECSERQRIEKKIEEKKNLL